MLDIFSNKLDPINFEQESELIKNEITQLLSDIDSRLRYRRKQPTSADIDKLEERYKKIKEKLKKIEENFKKEINRLKLDRSNLNGKNFQQNATVQGFSDNSSSITKLSSMNNIIEKFTDNKRKFLIKLITTNQAFKKIKNKYTNSNVNKINNKALENATKNAKISKNSGNLYKSIIKLYKLLNSLERPNSTIALRKILLNINVKSVKDILKLINEKKNFLLEPNKVGENVPQQVSEFNKLKKNASTNSSSNQPPKTKTETVSTGTGPEPPEPTGPRIGAMGTGTRMSTRATAGQRTNPNPNMLTGQNAIAAMTKETQGNRRQGPPSARNQSNNEQLVAALSNATQLLSQTKSEISGNGSTAK